MFFRIFDYLLRFLLTAIRYRWFNYLHCLNFAKAGTRPTRGIKQFFLVLDLTGHCSVELLSFFGNNRFLNTIVLARRKQIIGIRQGCSCKINWICFWMKKTCGIFLFVARVHYIILTVVNSVAAFHVIFVKLKLLWVALFWWVSFVPHLLELFFLKAAAHQNTFEQRLNFFSLFPFFTPHGINPFCYCFSFLESEF